MGDAKTDAARRHFDSWSATYEQDGASRFLRQLQAQALDLLRLGAEDLFLDVACGTGAAVREAAPRVRRAVGVDLSDGMIARARTLAAGLENTDFTLGESDHLPLGDGSVTAVLCTTAFHHFPRPDGAVREMARVLAPGGRLVIADANADRLAVRVFDLALKALQRSHVRICPPAELVPMLEAAGLCNVTMTTGLGGYYAFIHAQVA